MASEYHRDYMRRYRALHKAIKLPNDWPRNSFGHPYNIDELMAGQSEQRQQTLPDLCHCGCKTPHHNLYPLTIRSEHGRGFNVYYFASDAHKAKWLGSVKGKTA